MSLPSDSDGAAPRGLILEPVPGTFGICRFGPRARLPRWLHRSSFFSVSRSSEELSVLCEDHLVPERVQCERGWSAICVAGTLDMSLIGVLASMAQPLAEAKIGLFTVSTYDTDYLLVRESKLEDAKAVLEAAGHQFKAPSVEEEAELTEETREEAEPAQATTDEASVREGAISNEQGEAEEAAETKDSDRAPVAVAPAEQEPVESEPAQDDSVKEAKRPRRRRRRRNPLARVLSEFGLSRKTDEDAEEEPVAAQDEAGEEQEAPEEAAPDAAATAEAEVAAPEADKEPAQDLQKQDETEPAQDPKKEDDAGARAKGLFTGAIPQHEVEITDKSFEDLGLSAPILETVREVGFTHPTPIQARVIPVALEGFDVIGLAETGSGKTAAFCLPLAERLTHGRGTRGLILCPTREIALQTKAFLDIFGRDHALETVAVIGGVKMGPQIDGFRRDADILVATPGRLADHLRRRNVSLDKLEELVLDEADHMLDLGFLPQIKEILEQIPDDHRTLMFSATMPPPIERLAQIFMRNPVRCDIRPEGQIATGIEHRLYLVKDEDRKNCLFALLREIEGSTLIFVRRKLYTEWLARQLELAGFPVARIHSDRSQSQRVKALRAFREGNVRILVATDVAARGIDVPQIQHVINFGLPEQVEDYVHRAGRTARGSAAGVVSTIGTWQDKLMVRDIELDLGIELPRTAVEGVEPYRELPKRKTVRRRRLL